MLELKRSLDIIVSTVLIMVLSPVFIALALGVRTLLGAPMLFRQERIGLHGHPFVMLKFRSMTDERDSNGDLLSDALRLTRFGSWLRSTSLDELPELLNVLQGDMSLVGPRPLLRAYLQLYTPEQARRHEVRPGVTGWAQISGRNSISWEERFALDVWYVDHQSLWLDIKILMISVWTVFARKGIGHHSEATMPKFSGSNGDS